MLLIVGLGNIGKDYDCTPHNAGFLAVDKLLDITGYNAAYSVTPWDNDPAFEAYLAKARSGLDVKVLFMKPTTLMNLSGRAVKKLTQKLAIDVSNDLVVIHDDLDIELGHYKIEKGRGPKGHNGVNNVTLALGRGDYWRMRIGIADKMLSDIPGERYVLMKMDDDKLALLEETIIDAITQLKQLRNI